MVRSAQMRSPNTPFDAQLRVERGGLNSRGLTIIQTIERATGIRQYQPIQSRLQIESASSERTEKRVQTLRGFAWRIHVSPSRPKSLATRRSEVGGEAAICSRMVTTGGSRRKAGDSPLRVRVSGRTLRRRVRAASPASVATT